MIIVEISSKYVIYRESLNLIGCATNLHSFNLLSFYDNVIGTDIIGDNYTSANYK